MTLRGAPRPRNEFLFAPLFRFLLSHSSFAVTPSECSTGQECKMIDRLCAIVMRLSVWAALVTGLLTVFGCASIGPRYERLYLLRANVIVHVCDWETVKDEYKAQYEGSRLPVLSPWGFADNEDREIWVTGIKDGLPDMRTLGHEVWHMPELGGPNWHRVLNQIDNVTIPLKRAEVVK